MKKYATIAAICNKIISGMPTINFACLVLWRIKSIVMSIATDPPIADHPRRTASGILHACLFAFILSAIVIIIDMTDTTAK